METSMLSGIYRLQKMTVPELQREWEAVFGSPTTSTNRQHLWRKLAWEVQARARGGLNDNARARLDELGEDAWNVATSRHQRAHDAAATPDEPEPRVVPIRDLRRPAAGTVIVREYRGHQLRLLVLDDGFELDGIRYDSLSEAARAATGSRWNGWLFWGLVDRKRKR